MQARTVKFVGARVLVSEGFYRPFMDFGEVHRVGDFWGYCDCERGVYLRLCDTEDEAKRIAAAHLEAEIIDA